MPRPSVEERLNTLESQVAQLQNALVVSQRGEAKDWRRAVQKYAGDADLQSIFAAAMKLRDADRKQARQGKSRRKLP